jgi:hypothetical protein
MSRYYSEAEEYGDRCHGCGKRNDFCRCEDWGGPKPPPEPKDYTFSHYDLGLRKRVYGGAMTKTHAELWAKALTCAKRVRVAQAGTVKVLRRLPVLQTRCTCPPQYGYDKSLRIATRWDDKGRM